jgi:hypothetical protein
MKFDPSENRANQKRKEKNKLLREKQRLKDMKKLNPDPAKIEVTWLNYFNPAP